MFRLLHLLGPLSAPTLTLAAGRLGRIHHAMDERSPTRTVASLHVRIGQLTCQDSHPEDRGLIGRYTTPGCSRSQSAHTSSRRHFGNPRAVTDCWFHSSAVMERDENRRTMRYGNAP